MNFLERLDELNRIKWLIVVILIVDAVAMGYGWFYYWQVGQFDPASSYFVHYVWWPLVADSPNAVLLFFAATLAWTFFGKRHAVLDAFAFILNVYVGLWTSALFLLYADIMGTWNWGSTNNILFFAHFGMPLQALLLAHRIQGDTPRVGPLAAGAAFLAFYIVVDYVWPVLHPAPFLHPNDAELHIVSPILMVVAAGAYAAVLFTGRGRRRSSPQ